MPAVVRPLIARLSMPGLPLLQSDNAYPRNTGEMRNNAVPLAVKSLRWGSKSKVGRGRQPEKSLPCWGVGDSGQSGLGGMTFMTDAVHEIAAGGGLVPGRPAVLPWSYQGRPIERCLIQILQGPTPCNIDRHRDSDKDPVQNLEEAASFLERRNRRPGCPRTADP